jgi:iron complex outermembrane receptor protein
MKLPGKGIYIILLLTFLSSIQLYSQRQVSGKITDSNSGEPLLGATVVIKGSVTGNMSSTSGEYN